MSVHPLPVRPPSLGDAGSRLWDDIMSYVDDGLREDRAHLLAHAAHEADIVDRLEQARADHPMVVQGSQRQPTADPVLVELRLHRAVLCRLLKELRLDGSTGRPTLSSDEARRRVAARWKRGTVNTRGSVRR